MNKISALILLCAASAFAATTTTPVPTVEEWTMKRDTTVFGPTYATRDACATAAQAHAETAQKSANYSCSDIRPFRVTYTSAPPPAVLSAQIQATRASGVAPLAVLFDATGTTTTTAGTDTFRQVNYAFDFGDDRGLTWGVSGAPKNAEAGGPIAAHVFDLPGTYTIRVRATASGATSDATVTVTVADPNVYYAGTKTVCVSPAANYTGCPSGATQRTSYPTSWTGKRVLLRRGESFADISLQDGNANVQIGAYGSGTVKPVVASVAVGNWRPNTPAFATDITAMDLNVQQSMLQCLGSRVLFYRNDVHTSGGGINMAFGGETYWAVDDPYRFVPSSAFRNAHEIFYVENSVVNPDTTSAEYGIFGSGSRVALLGNTVSRQKYHSIRLTSLHKSIVAHNDARGINDAGIYHVIKIHGSGLEPYSDARINGYSGQGGWATSQVVMSNNIIGSALDINPWTLAVAPQNDQYAEGVEDVIVEKNRFVRGVNTNVDIAAGGRRITSRGNVVTNGSVLSTTIGHDAVLPAAWKGPYFLD